MPLCGLLQFTIHSSRLSGTAPSQRSSLTPGSNKTMHSSKILPGDLMWFDKAWAIPMH